MAERSGRDLRYGHPGRAVYNPQSRNWIFGRNALSFWRFENVGVPTAPISPSTQTAVPTLSDGASLLLQAQRVARTDPDTLAGSDYLRFESRISETVTAQTFNLDPNQGGLLDFGFAHTTFRCFQNAAPVAALPGGAAGGLLRLVHMETERQGWDKDHSKWMESVDPNVAEIGWWAGIGQPIQQVCFAHLTQEKFTFLAARTTSTVCILVPLRHSSATVSKAPLPGSNSFPASRFGLKCLSTLSAQQLGLSPPADVSFNPWKQRQFAVMNQKGDWSIWEFKGGKKRQAYLEKVTRITKGQLPKPLEGANDSENTAEDGWGRLMWIMDRNTLVICNRTALCIYDMSSELLLTETSMIGISEKSDWLLDVRQHPMSKDQFFATTNRQIYWLQVTETGQAIDSPVEQSRVRVLLCWTHFRDPEDISLRTTVFQCANETILLVYSRVNSLVTAFRLSLDDKVSLPVSVSDPIQIPLPSDIFPESSSKNDACPTINSISVRPMTYHRYAMLDHLNLPSGTWDEYKKKGVRLCKMFVLLRDWSVRKFIFNIALDTIEGGNVTSSTENVKVRQPTWKHFAGRTAATLASEDFISADGIIGDDDKDAIKPYLPRHWRQETVHCDTKKPHVYARTQDNLALPDYNRIYRQILKDGKKPVDVERTLEHVRIVAQRERSAKKVVTVKLLSDNLTSMLRVNNVDACSIMLKQHFGPQDEYASDDDEEARRPAYVVAAAVSDQLVDATEGTPNLSTSIEGMKTDWVAPLASKVSPQALSVIEDITKSVAADLCLASLFVPVKKPSEDQVQAESHETHDPSSTRDFSQFSLPVRNSQGNTKQRNQLFKEPQNMDPSSSSQTGLQTSLSESVDDVPSIDPSALRLSHYMRIAQLPPGLPPRLSRILAHWETDSSPEEYDWQATTARLRTSSTRKGRQEAEEERRKEEEAREKRRKASRWAGRTIGGGSQEKPGPSRPLGEPGFAASQPMAPARGFGGADGTQQNQSQSQTQMGSQRPGLVVASQMEPGRFGGRAQLPAKKKPKKVQGFR